MRRLLIALLVLCIASLAAVAETQRRAALVEVRNLTDRLEDLGGTNDPERVREIVDQVRRHIELPADEMPTVATIADVEALRADNPFFNKAKNGDVLVVTRSRAILLDLERDVLLDVVPVQFEPAAGSGSEMQ